MTPVNYVFWPPRSRVNDGPDVLAAQRGGEPSRNKPVHLRCTKCGSVRYVDHRRNWSDVIDFKKALGY